MGYYAGGEAGGGGGGRGIGGRALVHTAGGITPSVAGGNFGGMWGLGHFNPTKLSQRRYNEHVLRIYAYINVFF